MSVQGKVAVLTGACGGIGQAIARKLVAQGARVLATDLSQDGLAALQRELGVTSLYVTHDQVEAMTLATRIVVLAGGGIAQVGSPLDLYERPENEFVAQFIGSPAMNMVPARMSVGDGVTATADGSGAVMDLAGNLLPQLM